MTEETEKNYLNVSRRINLLNIQYADRDVCLKVHYLKYLTYNLEKQRRVNSKTHNHSFFEMHLIMKGDNLYNIENQTVSIGSGGFVLVSPGVRHSFISNSPEFSKVALCFDLEFPDGSTLKRYDRFLTGKNFISGICNDHIMEPLNYMFLHMGSCNEANNKMLQWNILTLLLAVLEQCIGNSPVPISEDGPEILQNCDDFIGLCKSLLRENLASKSAIEDLADQLYMSDRQLRRRVRCECGKSPKQLLDELRCERIRTLLLAQEHMSDICSCVGLSDEHSLNRFFKRVEGITPGEFRSAMLKSNYPLK